MEFEGISTKNICKSDSTDTSLDLSHSSTKLAVQAAIDQKALDVRALHVEAQTSIANFFVIASGTSERHVKGIADKIETRIREEGKEKPQRKTGNEETEWVILDYGDLMVHVFYEPTRQYYNFDELWKNARVLDLPEELEKQLKKLRTGIY